MAKRDFLIDNTKDLLGVDDLPGVEFNPAADPLQDHYLDEIRPAIGQRVDALHVGGSAAVSING